MRAPRRTTTLGARRDDLPSLPRGSQVSCLSCRSQSRRCQSVRAFGPEAWCWRAWECCSLLPAGRRTAIPRCPAGAKSSGGSHAAIETDKGTIEIEFLSADAPKAVENFRLLAEHGYYDGLTFHRIVKRLHDSGRRSGGRRHRRAERLGAAVRRRDQAATRRSTAAATGAASWRWPTPGPNTNGSQFFIMHENYPLPPNYVIFARVTSGLDVVDALANIETTRGSDGAAEQADGHAGDQEGHDSSLSRRGRVAFLAPISILLMNLAPRSPAPSVTRPHRRSHDVPRSVVCRRTIALVLAVSGGAIHAAGPAVVPPAVPSNLIVPAGHKPFLLAHAVGSQNYSCLPNGYRTSRGSFPTPQATSVRRSRQPADHPLPERQSGRERHPAPDLAALGRYQRGLGGADAGPLVHRRGLRRAWRNPLAVAGERSGRSWGRHMVTS